MRRRGLASATVLLPLLVSSVPAHADVLADVVSSLGLVPGAIVGRPADAIVEVGAAQMLTFADAHAGWARARLPLNATCRVELVGARLRAGAWREDRHEARLVVEAARLGMSLSAAAVRARVADWASLRHGRGGIEAAYRLGPAHVGVRWEGPWTASSEWAPASLAIHVRAEGAGWSAGVWRPRARFAVDAAWGAGFAANLHDRARVGVRAGTGRTDLMLWVSAGVWRLDLAVPVVSRVGAGPTLAVGWAP